MESKNNGVMYSEHCKEPKIKEEFFNQDEIATPCIQQEAHFMECVQNGDVDTKIGIKPEIWDLNSASMDIKPDIELPPTCLGSGTIKDDDDDDDDDEIDIKEELWWCEGASADSLNKGKESGSKKDEIAEDVSLLESPRPYTNVVYSYDATQLQENKNSSSLSVKTNKPAEKCERKHRCEICGKTFKLILQLKKHNLVHKKCDCTNCDKNCIFSGILKDHLIHNPRRQYMCDICGKTFCQLRGLKAHLLIHDGKRQYKCEICEKGFKRLDHMKTHLLIHDEKRPYKCEICKSTFKMLNHLKSHLLSHTYSRPYRCEICEKSFTLSQHLKSHLLIHGDKRQFKCDICAKSFRRMEDLKRHCLIHSEKGQYKCEICEKHFKQLNILKRHLLIHDEKKKFKCEICAKRFRRLEHMKAHVLIHSGKRQFKCALCEKAFWQLRHLKRHSLVHGN